MANRKGVPYKTEEERKTARVYIRMEQDYADRLDQIARVQGVTKSALIRKWIDTYSETLK